MKQTEAKRRMVAIFHAWIEGNRREAADLAKTLNKLEARRLHKYGSDIAELGEAVFLDLCRQQRDDKQL